MWWCNGSTWGNWGPPFWMFFLPFLFILVMFLVFRFFRHGMIGCCGHSFMTNSQLGDEVSRLRQEVAELRKNKT